MRRLLTITFLVMLTSATLALDACTRRATPSAPTFQNALSAAEISYGQSPARSDASIEYQPDVIKIDDGPQAVHGVSADGMTWTFDANAPHASDVAAGKVLFLTSRAVGRVLGVTRDGNDLAVVLGPIAITDLIKEAHLSTDQPIDLNAMSVYTAPSYPQGAVASAATSRLPSVKVVRLDKDGNASDPSPLSGLFAQPALADASGTVKEVDVSDFHTEGVFKDGVGIHFWYDKNGVTVNGFEGLRMGTPRVHFELTIEHGVVKTAKVELSGAIGVVMRLVMSSAVGVHGNLHTDPIFVPTDLSWPIVNAPPFQVVLHQSFEVKTAFSSRNSVITAYGDYSFNGAFVMGYDNGSWHVSAPTELVAQHGLVDSIGGLALGAESVVMTYNFKVIAGVGAFGFVVGPYLGWTDSIGISNAGIVAGLPCRGAIMSIDMSVGVGYSIPSLITAGINIFLRALKLRPIEGTDGPKHTEKVFTKHGAIPAGCGGY
jgi:hypothetical protein